MPPDEFARTGLSIYRAGGTPTRFQVLGERSSGTNFVKRLLGRNSNLTPVETLGWKHGPPSALAIPEDLAVICVVRNATDWALSMHAKPWHCTPEMQHLPFSDFIRAEWQSIVDRPRYFPEAAASGGLGRPLQADRDPQTGGVYDNLFALRRGKFNGLLSYLQRRCTCVLLRMEQAQSDPESMLDRILGDLGLPPRTGPVRPVHKRLGAKFKPSVPNRPPSPAAIGADDRAFMISQLDMETEAALGYRY